jgi:hypothetical protein
MSSVIRTVSAATLLMLLASSPRAEAAVQDLKDEVNAAAVDAASVTARRGYDLTAPFRTYAADATGRVTIYGEEVDLFELRLSSESAVASVQYTGYIRVINDLAPLPIGSRLDALTGVFTWNPGVGFIHAYDLVFVRWQQGRAIARQEVRFVLSPKGSGLVGPQIVIDTPTKQADVGQPFVLAGWALDLDAPVGTGVDTLHVWAYPLTGAPPVFAGVTAYGGERADVGAIFGDRFAKSGYSLTVQGLVPGNYDLAVFAWSTAVGGFVPAKVVRVTVR